MKSEGILVSFTGAAVHVSGEDLLTHLQLCCGADGSTAQLQVGKQILTRHVNSSTGEGNQNSLTLHFGLGLNPPKDLELVILWPGGTKQKQLVESGIFNTIKKQ